MQVIPLAVFRLCVQGLKNIWTTNTVLQEHLLQGRAALFGNLLIPFGHNISGVQLQLSPLKSSWEHTPSSWACHPLQQSPSSRIHSESSEHDRNVKPGEMHAHHTSFSSLVTSDHFIQETVLRGSTVTTTAYNVHKTNPAGRRWGVQSGYMLLICSVCV